MLIRLRNPRWHSWLDKVTFKFIWDNKPAKIKKRTIIGNKKEGGLNMTSFVHIEKALKLAWVKRLLDEKQSEWKMIPRSYLSKYGGLFLFSCDFNKKELVLSNTPNFYKCILSYTQNFNALNLQKQNILNSFIWNNKHIKVGNASVFYKSWFDKGVKSFEDLIGPGNKFISFSEFTKKYNINTNFLTYGGIVNAVRNRIKQNNSTIIPEKPPNNLTKMTVKIIRQFFSKIEFEHPTNEPLILNEGFTQKDLNAIYSLPFSVTKEIKLSVFQFKIIHNILPLNDYLKKVGIKNDDSCPFCIDKERHTCKHFFYLCTHARYFWNKFQSWWSSHIDAKSQLKLDLGTILYGHLSNFKYSLFLNHLILIAKQHMYNSFINEQKYTFPSFLNHATNKYQIEKRIALSSNTKQLSNVFEKKWAPFTNFLSKTA